MDLRYGRAVPGLRASRIAHQLTQVELAQKAHLSRRTIIDAEHGKPIQARHIAQLARALAVSREALIGSQA